MFLIKILIKYKNILSIKKIKAIIKSFKKYENKYEMYDKKTFIDFLNKEYNYNFKYEIYDVLNDYYAENYGNKLNNNAKDVLKYLSKKYELVIYTNYIYKVQYERLKKAGILKYFKEIYAGDKIPLKPNKEGYIKSCGKYKLTECVIIGDNLVKDYLEPKKLGMQAILFDKNNKYDNKYKKIKDLKELKEIL